MKKQYQCPTSKVINVQTMVMTVSNINGNAGFVNGGEGLDSDVARGRDAYFWE